MFHLGAVPNCGAGGVQPAQDAIEAYLAQGGSRPMSLRCTRHSTALAVVTWSVSLTAAAFPIAAFFIPDSADGGPYRFGVLYVLRG